MVQSPKDIPLSLKLVKKLDIAGVLKERLAAKFDIPEDVLGLVSEFISSDSTQLSGALNPILTWIVSRNVRAFASFPFSERFF